MERLLAKPEVLELVGLSGSTVWRLMRRGEFPMSVRIGGAVRWHASEIEAFISALPKSQLKAAPPRPPKKSAEVEADSAEA